MSTLTPSSPIRAVSRTVRAGTRSLWAGRLMCAAAAFALVHLALRGAFGLDLSVAHLVVGAACAALLVMACARSRWSLRVGAYSLAFAGSLGVLSHTADMMPESELASLRDVAARQAAIFETGPLTN